MPGRRVLFSSCTGTELSWDGIVAHRLLSYSIVALLQNISQAFFLSLRIITEYSFFLEKMFLVRM